MKSLLKDIQICKKNYSDYIRYEIYHKKENSRIGSISLKGILFINESLKKGYEFGYGINKDFWNKGIMTESVKLFSNDFFTNFKQYVLYAETLKGNIASQKVLRNNDFKIIYEKTLTYIWLKEKSF
ncbi:GNAT family N-acetyltransferase [Oceanotoga sp. DSM 15011]|uniref:GNAT family N-acetyltransferase n=1 Tax=Oceanotoga sp. DSM 15011 TaxID=2984951 RepID=UPI0021F4F7F6|nr:GNAT family N-acetyltransferase [Oceanotoga sp. DSM 15011]UYO99585.1 GNAT family N-acetyltransferase [Oceanotoga sp. DSM 15011]